MGTEIKMRVDFVLTSGGSRSFTNSVTDPYSSQDDNPEALAQELFAELKKAVSFHNFKNPLPSLGQSPLGVTAFSTDHANWTNGIY